MKTFKSLTIVLGLLLAVTLTSCQKDQMGVYSPKKKIQKIFYSAPYVEKTPYQVWAWNDNKLSSITQYYTYNDYYYNPNSVAWIESFTYDNNKIVRVDNLTESEYITYEYDGDNLKSATVYYRNAIVCIWTFSYENKKINKLSGTIYDYDYKKNSPASHLSPLSHLLPPIVCDKVEQYEQKLSSQRNPNEAFIINLLLTWDGDNISQIIYTGDGEYLSFQLEYDDKNCPLYGFLGNLEDYLTNLSTGHSSFNKNNITKMVMIEGHYADTALYAYQYDKDNYPILQTVRTYNDEDEKEVLYFEY